MLIVFLAYDLLINNRLLNKKFDKGKLLKRAGRKAAGLSPREDGYGGRAAER
jgi:hypothetical protein